MQCKSSASQWSSHPNEWKCHKSKCLSRVYKSGTYLFSIWFYTNLCLLCSAAKLFKSISDCSVDGTDFTAIWRICLLSQEITVVMKKVYHHHVFIERRLHRVVGVGCAVCVCVCIICGGWVGFSLTLWWPFCVSKSFQYHVDHQCREGHTGHHRITLSNFVIFVKWY